MLELQLTQTRPQHVMLELQLTQTRTTTCNVITPVNIDKDHNM